MFFYVFVLFLLYFEIKLNFQRSWFFFSFFFHGIENAFTHIVQDLARAIVTELKTPLISH